MCDDKKHEPNPNQLQFPPALHLTDMGIEVAPKLVMLHDDFIAKYVSRTSSRNVLEVKCPYCDQETLYVTKNEPAFSAGPHSGPLGVKHHVSDNIELECKNCGAHFFGEHRRIYLD